MYKSARNQWTRSLTAGLLVLSCSTSVLWGQAADVDAQYKAITDLHRARQYDQAANMAREAVKNPALNTNQKLRLLKAQAEAYRNAPIYGASDAVDVQKEILALKDVSNAEKIKAYRQLSQDLLTAQAGKPLEDMDALPSEKVLLEALKLPDMTDKENAEALLNLADFYLLSLRNDEARKLYIQVLKMTKDNNQVRDAHTQLAELEIREGRLDKAKAIYEANGLDMIAFYRSNGNEDQLIAQVIKELDDQNVPDARRWRAFSWDLPMSRQRGGGWDKLLPISQKYLPGLLEKDPARVGQLSAKFNEALASNQSDYVLWLAPTMLSQANLTDEQYNNTQDGLLEAYASKRNLEALAKQADALISDAKASDTLKAKASIVKAALASKNADLTKAIDAATGKLDAKASVRVRNDAAEMLLRAGLSHAAMQLSDSRDRLVVVPARATLDCLFMDEAPFDAGSWLASTLIKDFKRTGSLDRPYGNNVQALVATDASTTGRDVGNSTVENPQDRQTDLQTACDVNGIYIYLKAYDSQAAAVVAGKERGGSYEMYIAPGPHQPYATFLARLPEGSMNPEGFITMYPNANYHQLSTTKGTMRTNTRVLPDGYATCIFLSWEAYYDILPSRGDAWQFEAIRWTRSGGLTFGGSKSVHNRSSFGDFVFSNLTEENLRAIKTRIIYKAMGKYRASKGITGVAGNWADPELGDPAFYNARILPLLKDLDSYLPEGDKALSPEEIERVYTLAVPGWMEIEYRIASLRTQWLAEQLLGQ